jgi:hypothetical protein
VYRIRSQMAVKWPYAPAAPYPQEDFRYAFVRVLVDLKVIVRLEGLG